MSTNSKPTRGPEPISTGVFLPPMGSGAIRCPAHYSFTCVDVRRTILDHEDVPPGGLSGDVIFPLSTSPTHLANVAVDVSAGTGGQRLSVTWDNNYIGTISLREGRRVLRQLLLVHLGKMAGTVECNFSMHDDTAEPEKWKATTTLHSFLYTFVLLTGGMCPECLELIEGLVPNPDKDLPISLDPEVTDALIKSAAGGFVNVSDDC